MIPLVDVKALLKMHSTELDELWSDSPVGDTPDGVMDGTVIVAPGTPISRPIARHVKQMAWKGKTFDRARGVLTNRIVGVGNIVLAHFYRGPSWYDQLSCLILDYSVSAPHLRDELRQLGPGLYLGKAYLNRKPLVYFALEPVLSAPVPAFPYKTQS